MNIKLNDKGLVPAIAQDCETNEILMLGYMNEKALKLSIKTGTAHYWSRSRKTLWRKGETSGLVQRILELRVDDDQDALWLCVDIGSGASCHVGYRSCFYRKIRLNQNLKVNKKIMLSFSDSEKVFDPEIVYSETSNPTKL